MSAESLIGRDQLGLFNSVFWLSALAECCWPSVSWHSWSLYFRCSQRGASLLPARLMPHRKVHVWDLCDTVVGGWGAVVTERLKKIALAKSSRNVCESMSSYISSQPGSFPRSLCFCICGDGDLKLHRYLFYLCPQLFFKVFRWFY